MTTTTPPDARNALAEILAGLDGVTPGKWCQFHPSYCEEAKNTSFSSWDTSHDLSAVLDGTRYRIGTFKHAADAAHVDRLDSATMRSIADYVAALEAQVEGMRVAIRAALIRLELYAGDGEKFAGQHDKSIMAKLRASLQSSETTGEK